MARLRGGAVARWRGGAVERWCGGAMARWQDVRTLDYDTPVLNPVLSCQTLDTFLHSINYYSSSLSCMNE